MNAIVLREGETTPRLVDLPRPEPADGEVLVRTLRVGVDGTDHDVVRGGRREFPEGHEFLVLGHEAVGVVVDSNGMAFDIGDVVVPTVRRPPTGNTTSNGTNQYFQRGEPDMAPSGEYVECGIVGAHGFMSDFFVSPAEFLVSIPSELASLGFLVEPVSISEKALELAAASRSSFGWTPESALVLGTGSLGLLTLAMLGDRYDRLYCLGRRNRPDPAIDIVERLGGTYVDARQTPLPEVADAYEPADFVFEATGYAKHAFEAVHALAPNGVAALVGAPEPWTFEVDGGALHRELVLHNKAVVGSVNSNRRHFEAATESLAALPGWFSDSYVTRVYALEEFERAFADDDTNIKTAVQLSDYEER
ncbi:MAG: glucose 1-dehydrogenase [Halobacteriota archaeon]